MLSHFRSPRENRYGSSVVMEQILRIDTFGIALCLFLGQPKRPRAVGIVCISGSTSRLICLLRRRMVVTSVDRTS
jgi:hypothetical protein